MLSRPLAIATALLTAVALGCGNSLTTDSLPSAPVSTPVFAATSPAPTRLAIQGRATTAPNPTIAAGLSPSTSSTQPPVKTPNPTPKPTDIADSGDNLGQTLLRLDDPLDEPEYYCVDVPGAGSNVRLQSPLQAHTCKPLSQAADELFTINQPSQGQGQIFMHAYNLCVEAGEAAADHPLLLRTCSDSPLQRFAYTPEGHIVLADGPQRDLCVAVAPGSGIPTGGPSHLRRGLALQPCATVDPSLAKWSATYPGG